jgi:hypothetical protein
VHVSTPQIPVGSSEELHLMWTLPEGEDGGSAEEEGEEDRAAREI